MTQFYIGTKQVEAWPEPSSDGNDGYAIKYPDGYQSWSPARTFESAYLPMGEDSDGSKINEEMVESLIASYEVSTVGQCTAVVVVTLVNGFEITESSACVDPANYDEAYGAEIALDKAKSKIWGLLGFLLQCARFGVAYQGPKEKAES